MYVALVKALTPLLLLFMTEDCLDAIFLKFDILNIPCLKLIISKCLGYAIVAGSMMVKFPQIIKIYSNSSVVGLSVASFLMETTCAMINCSYNFAQGFPFSTWGENFFILLQLIILLAQYYHYTRNTVLALVVPLLVPVISFVLTQLPVSQLAVALTLTIPLLALSKILQIKTNFLNGHTGQLSFVTSLLNFLGVVARLFTVLQEVDDSLILANVTSTAVLNGVIVLQFYWYWNVTPPKAKTQ